VDWLEVLRGDQPLIVSIPHAGTAIPPEIERRLVSPERARVDADWWVDQLYGFAAGMGATVVRTAVSRTVIDLNRDPSGASLYPGQATTGLCPETTFDGEPLYLDGQAPDAAEVAERRAHWFEPYHAALAGEIERLRGRFGAVVLYDAHSIRSDVPRLFGGQLPHFNIGTNDAKSCAPELTAAVEQACADPRFTRVTNGRFKGGWITRHYGQPGAGAHAIQMELAWRSYMDEPADRSARPGAYDAARAAQAQGVLRGVLQACLDFARFTGTARL
jgi:N-formylglutamate deformylase